MQSASVEITRPAQKQYSSMVSAQFRKDIALDGLPYQTGIRSAMLWPNKLQCLRVIPGFDQTTGEVYRQLIPGKPFVRNCDYDPADYLSDSFFKVRTISGLGEGRHTVITSYRPGSPEAQRWAGNTIIHWFCADISRAVKAQEDGKQFHLTPAPEWTRWLTYDQINKKMPILQYDRDTIMFQALVYTLNDKPNTYKAEGDTQYVPLVDAQGNALPVLYLCGIDNNNTIRELCKALIEPADPSKPLDGLTNNSYHGIAEQDGSILYMLPQRVTKGQKTQNVLQPHVSDNPEDWTPTPYPLTDEQIHGWWKPWDQLLNFMTPDEQCELLASQFGADTVNYVIGSCAALAGYDIPESIAKAGLGRYAAQSKHASAAAPAGFGTMQPSSFQNTSFQQHLQQSAPKAPPAFGKKPAFGAAAPAAAHAPSPVTQRPAFGAPGLRQSGPDIKAELAKMKAAGARPAPQPAVDDMASLANELVGDVDYNDSDNPLLPGMEG